jgi:hypothetical protein
MLGTSGIDRSRGSSIPSGQLDRADDRDRGPLQCATSDPIARYRTLVVPLSMLRVQAVLLVCSSSRSTARRIQADTDRSSASAASRILARVSGGNLTGTSSDSLEARRRTGPRGVWLLGSAHKCITNEYGRRVSSPGALSS